MAQRVLNRAIGTNRPCRKIQHILFERLLFKLLDNFETFCLVALHKSIYEWCPGHRVMCHIYVLCRELVGSSVSHPGCTTARMKASSWGIAGMQILWHHSNGLEMAFPKEYVMWTKKVGQGEFWDCLSWKPQTIFHQKSAKMPSTQGFISGWKGV